MDAKKTEKPSGSRLAQIAVRNTIWVSLGTYLNLFIGFGATLVLTRLLTPEIFGLLSLANFWSTLLDLQSKLALNYAAIQQSETDGNLLGTFFALNFIANLGTVLLALLATGFLWWTDYPYELLLAIIVLVTVRGLTVFVSPFAMVLEKEIQLSRLTLVTLIASLFAYSIAILIALQRGDIWSLLTIEAITVLISSGGIYWVCRQRLPHTFQIKWRFERATAKKLLRTGIVTGLSITTISAIVTQYDNFLIGTFIGYTTLGFYDRAYRIANWTNVLLTMIVSRVGFVTFAKVQDDPPRLTHAVRLSLWVLSTLGIPIALFLFFGASDIVYIFYGPKWEESAFFLRFLVIYSLVWPFFGVGFWLSVALGHNQTTLVLAGAQAISLIILATPLTWLWGVWGTIIGVAITMSIGFILSNRYIFQQVTLSFRSTFTPPLFATLTAVIILFGLTQYAGWTNFHPLIRLFSTGITGSGIFLFMLFILRPQEMLDRIRYLGQTFIGRTRT